jgi:hypothetical protein
MKNPLTQAGIEPVTFRFVAQHLNHRATAVPIKMHDTNMKITSDLGVIEGSLVLRFLYRSLAVDGVYSFMSVLFHLM